MLRCFHLAVCVLVALLPCLTLQDSSTSLRGHAAAAGAPLRALEEKEGKGHLGGGRPTVGGTVDRINGTSFSEVAGNCGITVVDLPSGDLVVAHCSADAVVLDLAVPAVEKFTMYLDPNVSTQFAIDETVYGLAMAVFDGSSLLVAYHTASTVLVHQVVIGKGPTFEAWGIPAEVSVQGAKSLQLLALGSNEGLMSFISSGIARFCTVETAENLELVAQSGCDDSDVTLEHEVLAASAMRVLPNSLGALAVAIGTGSSEGSVWLRQLEVSAQSVQWSGPSFINISKDTIKEPIEAQSLGTNGELFVLFGTSSGPLVWCGLASQGGGVQGNSSVIPGANSSTMGSSPQAKIQVLETGAILVAYTQVDGSSSLRFASCQDSNQVEWGPTARAGVDSILSLVSVASIDEYGLAVLASSAGLIVATDLRCEAPSSALRYDTTRCDGTKPSSQCELRCAADAVGQNPIAECYENEGQFEFQGCTAPSCFLPPLTKKQRGFDFANCNTTRLGPLQAEQCELRCRSGASGALAVCSENMGIFQLAGCQDAECVYPSDTTGYELSQCNTSDGPLPAWLCQISCAANYSGIQPEATCAGGQDGEPGIFDFTGCKGKCVAPTGIDNAATPSCNGSFIMDHDERCNAACLEGFQPSPAQLRCSNGKMVPEDFECRENFCEAPTGVEHAPEFPCETGQLILPNQPCDTICDTGYTPTVKQLMCSKGKLSPPSHLCTGKNCTAPADVAHARDPPCSEGNELLHLGVCTGSCKEGYTAYPSVLNCNASRLQPDTFICGKNCKTPEGIEHALSPACDTGDQVLHGENCIALCEEGYTPLVNEMAESSTIANGVPQLRCEDGQLVPPYFSCAPGKCDAPSGVELAANPPCKEGWSIGHGGVCSAACLDGYSPNPPLVKCKSTTLIPSTFTCEASKCRAPIGIHAAHPGSSCAEGPAVDHEQICTPRCQFGHAASELFLSCVHGEFQPRTFMCRSVTHVSPPGVAAIGMAPLSDHRTSVAEQAVVLFLDGHAGLRARHVHIRDGAVSGGQNGVNGAKDDMSVEARWEGNEVLPRSLVLVPTGNQVIAVYARRQICGEGRMEIVALKISPSGQGNLALGTKALLSIEDTAGPLTLSGAPLGVNTGLLAIATTSGVACIASATAGSQASLSAASKFSSTTTDNLAIASLGPRELFLAHASSSCTRFQRGTVGGGNQIQWQPAKEVLMQDECLEAGPMSAAAVTNGHVLFVAGSPHGKGTASLATSGASGIDFGSMEALVQGDLGPETILEVACSVVSEGAQARALIAYRQGSSVTVRWATINGQNLQISSAVRQIAGVSSIPWSLASIGPTASALVYTDLERSWRGASLVLADLRCTLPEALEGYDPIGCEGSNVYASRCRIRCLAPFSGIASATCSQNGGTFSVDGCMAACVAPNVESAESPSCVEGEFITAGTHCTPSCLPGHQPDLRNIWCWYENGVSKLNDKFTCQPNGCAAPTCIENAAHPSCAEGWHIRHGSACMPVCQPGYIPSEPHLACYAATLTPSTFRCERVGIPCSVDHLKVEGAADPPCLEGTIILDGSSCTPLCDDSEGRVPTLGKLVCMAGELKPSTFECAAPCLAPAAVPNALAPPCKEGFRLPHGGVCTLACKFGYQAQPTSLTCNRGKFVEDNADGRLYKCVLTAKSCNSPTIVLHLNVGERTANASQGLNFCQEGAVIAHGSECNARCEFSSYSSDTAQLFCNDGLLTPPIFKCGRICDAGTLLGYVRNSKSPACEGGVRIRHAGYCIPSCRNGFTGTAKSLECFDGDLTPAGFECEQIKDGCEAPKDIEAVSQVSVCHEGDYIEKGGICTASCEAGFMPDTPILKCEDQQLTPPTFSCFVLCQAPAGIPNGGFCQEGPAIAHSKQCTASCEPGFLPSIPALRCQFGSLAPSTFKCHRYCVATVGVAGIYRDAEVGLRHIGEPACKEGDSGIISHGNTCTAQCVDGFVASEETLSCDEGILTPLQFQCTGGLQCSSPEKIDDAGIPSCVEGENVPHNSSCTPRCQAGFLPSRTSLYCWNGELTPKEFECIPGCAAPSDPNAPNPACVEGRFIMPGAYCTARCRENFSPTAQRLRCSTSGSGSFSPEGFTCGRDCGTPSVAFAGDPPCNDGVPVRNAKVCRLNCSKDYAGFGLLLCREGSFIASGPGKCLQQCLAPPIRIRHDEHLHVHYAPSALPHVSELGEHAIRVHESSKRTVVGVLQHEVFWTVLDIHGMEGDLSILNGRYRLESKGSLRSVWQRSVRKASLYLVSFREHQNSTNGIWCITEDPACSSWFFWSWHRSGLDPGAIRGSWNTSRTSWKASNRLVSDSVAREDESVGKSSDAGRSPQAAENLIVDDTTPANLGSNNTAGNTTSANEASKNTSSGGGAPQSVNRSEERGPTKISAQAATEAPVQFASRTSPFPELLVASPPAIHIAVVNATFSFVLTPTSNGRATITKHLSSPEHFQRVARNTNWELSHELPARKTKLVVLEEDLDNAGQDLGVTLTGGSGEPFFVARVTPGSEAAAVDVQPGDELVSIGSQRTSAMQRSISAEVLLKGPLAKGITLEFAGPVAQADSILKFKGEDLKMQTDIGGGWIVRSVALGGPADLAGVVPGQYLTSVNGVVVEDYLGTRYGTGVEGLTFLTPEQQASGRHPVHLRFTTRGPVETLVTNAPSKSCREGEAIKHGASCTTRCNPSYLPFIKSLTCNDGQMIPASYTCVRNGNMTFDPLAKFRRGASFGAQVASFPESGVLALAFVDGGQLFVMLGSRVMKTWTWGQAIAHATSSDQGHDFLNRVAVLDKETFVLAFRNPDGHAVAQLGLTQPAALEFSFGCEHIITDQPFTELAMAVLGSSSRVLIVRVVGRGAAARAFVNLGRRHSSLLALQWSDVLEFATTGVSHIAVVALDDNRAAIGFNRQDEITGVEQGCVVLIEVSSGTLSSRFGQRAVFNDATTLHVSLAALAGNRLAVAYLDGRKLIPKTSLRLASFDGLELEWGQERPAGDAPALLLSMTTEGPLLVVASKSALWVAVEGLASSLGKETLLTKEEFYERSAPAGALLENNTVALLLPQESHLSTMQVAALKWTCLLPDVTEGYDVSLCMTGSGNPLSERECILSCSYGYTPNRPTALCPAPPEKAVFELRGCDPQPCMAPIDITNAAYPSCIEGFSIQSGAICHPQCLPGYEPSVFYLTCKAGVRTPNDFECLAVCCLQHAMRMMSNPVPAQIAFQGDFLDVLHTALNVLEDNGNGEGQVWLAPPSRSSWFTMDFGAAYFLHAVHLRNTYGEGWSTQFFHIIGTLDTGEASTRHLIYSGFLQPGSDLQELTLDESVVSLRIRFLRFEMHNFTGNGGGLAFIQVLGNRIESSDSSDAYPQCAAHFLPQASCLAPQGITNAKQPSCSEGKYVRSSSTCKPACQVGYMSSVESLSCRNGRLAPPSFFCIRAESIKEATGSQRVSDDSDFFLNADFGITISDLVAEETRTYIVSQLEIGTGPLSNGFMQALEAALVASGGQHICVFDIKSNLESADIRGAPSWNTSSGSTRILLSTRSGLPDINVSLQILAGNRTTADPIVNRISSLVSDGEVEQTLEEELKELWIPFLNASDRQQLLGGSWLEAAALPDMPALEMQVLTPELVATFTEELQQHIFEDHPELADMLPREEEAQAAGGGEEEDVGFYEAVMGRLYPLVEAIFGDSTDAVLSGGLLLFILLWFVMPPQCYYWFHVRKRPKFRSGNAGERQFRAVYIVPESHRHKWRMKGLSCRCRCEKRRACGCRCCCRRCRQRSCWCLIAPQQLQTCCTLCLCPCLRVPETWHVGGVLNFWVGVFAWYLCPICIPCFGICMRIRLRRVFAMPSYAVRDFCIWLCCCSAAALQEALHVDGAAEAMVARNEEAEARDSKLKADMDLQAHKARMRLAAARGIKDDAPRQSQMRSSTTSRKSKTAEEPRNSGNSGKGKRVTVTAVAEALEGTPRDSAKLSIPEAAPEESEAGSATQAELPTADEESNTGSRPSTARNSSARTSSSRRKGSSRAGADEDDDRRSVVSGTRRMNGNSVVIRKKKKHKDAFAAAEEESNVSDDASSDQYTDESSDRSNSS